MADIKKSCLNCKCSFDKEFMFCPYCGMEIFSLKDNKNNMAYLKLSEFRSKIAKEKFLPLYCIFNNDTLIKLATFLPESTNQLYQIKGMGPKRIEEHGSEILRIIKQNKDVEPYVKNIKATPDKDYAPLNIFRELKTKYPEHMIFIQSGFFYEVFGEDARECNRLFGWKLIERCGLDWTGVPYNAYNFKDELKSLSKPYIIVEQIIEGGILKREIVEKSSSVEQDVKDNSSKTVEKSLLVEQNINVNPSKNVPKIKYNEDGSIIWPKNLLKNKLKEKESIVLRRFQVNTNNPAIAQLRIEFPKEIENPQEILDYYNEIKKGQFPSVDHHIFMYDKKTIIIEVKNGSMCMYSCLDYLLNRFKKRLELKNDVLIRGNWDKFDSSKYILGRNRSFIKQTI
jgi:hypothetical protein